ncbi:MAG TPA: PAS domain-containing sensor histidine kinase [Bacteroidota bacterium]|nr:PAS domain-containing sensor histidine kinase [Bacteroidota bacterium]
MELPVDQSLIFGTMAEDPIHSTSALQTAILNGANYAIIATTRTGIIQIFNPAAQILLGYSSDEVVGKSTPLLFHDPDEIGSRSARYTQEYGRGIAPDCEVFTVIANLGLVDESEWTYVRHNGTRFPVFLSITALYDENENITGYLHIASDITRRKRTEEELLVALRKEKEVNELKTNVVTMVSHEFRTPMASILSSVEMLERYGKNWNDDKAQKAIKHYERVKDSIKRLTELLDEVLLVGKSDSGKMTYTPARFSLFALARLVADDLAMNALNSAKYIRQSIDLSLSEFVGDERLMRYILTNLLSNALKYSRDGGTVEFGVHRMIDHVVITVSDSGIGIAEEDLAYVFEPFRRAQNVGTIQGTGLGLSIVKRCVDLHHGSISITSSLGTGTTVTVTLPVTDRESAVETHTPATDHESDIHTHFTNTGAKDV